MIKQPSAFSSILRMPLIKRWALMHSIKTENVAEHSHQVAVIAHLLAVIRNMYLMAILTLKSATTALYHSRNKTSRYQSRYQIS